MTGIPSSSSTRFRDSGFLGCVSCRKTQTSSPPAGGFLGESSSVGLDSSPSLTPLNITFLLPLIEEPRSLLMLLETRLKPPPCWFSVDGCLRRPFFVGEFATRSGSLPGLLLIVLSAVDKSTLIAPEPRLDPAPPGGPPSGVLFCDPLPEPEYLFFIMPMGWLGRVLLL